METMIENRVDLINEVKNQVMSKNGMSKLPNSESSYSIGAFRLNVESEILGSTLKITFTLEGETIILNSLPIKNHADGNGSYCLWIYDADMLKIQVQEIE